MLKICIVLLLSVTVFACSKSNVNKIAVLNVKPTDLFTGEAKKFQPFLGLMSGAVKLKYHGSKKTIKAEIEIWENGTKKDTFSSFGGSLNEVLRNGYYNYDGEIIISVKKQNDDKKDIKKTRYILTCAFIDQNGSSSNETQIDVDGQMTSSMPIVLNNNGQDVSENENIAVWGMQASDQNSMQTVDFTPEMLKRVRWAMIVKVSLADN